MIGSDTFGGFPPRRSPLNMYDHSGCVFTDLAAVRRYLGERNVQIVHRRPEPMRLVFLRNDASTAGSPGEPVCGRPHR